MTKRREYRPTPRLTEYTCQRCGTGTTSTLDWRGSTYCDECQRYVDNWRWLMTRDWNGDPVQEHVR